MGVMLGAVEKTPQEAVQRMSNGVREFMEKYGSDTKVGNLGFIVYNDQKTADMLGEELSRVL